MHDYKNHVNELMIRLRQINLNVNSEESDIMEKCAKKLKIDVEKIKNYKIIKKSIDARNKSEILYCYELNIELKDKKIEKEVLKKAKSKDIFESPIEEYVFEELNLKKLDYRPVIVGSGPAGLFTAYMLAKNGLKPLILERGDEINKRVKKVEKFLDKGILDTESNVQFGEGGAGTFSDGKLNTLVKDKKYRNKKVLEIFVEMGAPEEILYLNKPHIGTDLLRNVIINLRNKIIEMGGEIKYNSCLTNIDNSFSIVSFFNSIAVAISSILYLSRTASNKK